MEADKKLKIKVSRKMSNSEFVLLTSLDTLQLTSLLYPKATTTLLYEAKVKAEATQKGLFVTLEKSIIACRKIPTHICPKDSKKAEEIMRLSDIECYNEFTASSGNLGQSCPGTGRLGIGNLHLEPKIHKDFISGFITKLPLDDLVLTRLLYQGVRKIQDENGQWKNEAIPLYFEGFFYLKRDLIYEATNNAFDRVENLGLVPTDKKSRTSKAPRPIDKDTVFCPLCEDCRFTRDSSMIYHLANHFNLKKFRCMHEDNGGPCLNKDGLPNQYLHPDHFKDHVARKHFFCEMCHLQYESLEKIHVHWIQNHAKTNLMPNWKKLGICKGKNEDESKKGHCSMNPLNQKPSGITSELVIGLAVDMFNMNGATTEFLEGEYNSKKIEYDAQVPNIKAQNLPRSNSKFAYSYQVEKAEQKANLGAEQKTNLKAEQIANLAAETPENDEIGVQTPETEDHSPEIDDQTTEIGAQTPEIGAQTHEIGAQTPESSAQTPERSEAVAKAIAKRCQIIEINSKKNLFVCEICHLNYTNSQDLDDHSEKHKTKISLRDSDLTNASNAGNPATPNSDLTNASDPGFLATPSFNCPLCGDLFCNSCTIY